MMTSPELDNLVRQGQLKREPPAASEISGYRSENRFLVFQVLTHTLGVPPAVWRVLSKGHESRNSAEYEGAIDLDERFVGDLIKAAEAVRVALRAADLPRES
jgi:hypothetical protein